jgi:broad specificity phosphatase PhoE
MDIFLVRHGEAAASWSESADPGLSEIGRQQAENAAVFLEQRISNDAELWSSPLRRALDTAVPLSRSIRKTVHEDPAFREIPSPVPLAERQAWLRNFMQQQWHEQSEDLIGWRAAALQQLLALQRPAVVFTHFLVINAVVGAILNRVETLCVWPSNGSITHLRHYGKSLELITLGEEMTTRVN